MKSLAIFFSCVVMFIMQIFLVSCEKEYVLIERTVNAVWSSDDSEIFKIVSIYETDAPEENYYFAPSGKNWKYRFEICTPDLAECVVVGHSDDIDQGGIMEYVPVYWLPKTERICTINPLNRAVLKNMQGQEELLELPSEISNVVFQATDSEYSAIDIAPSPNEDVIAVFFQAVYITSTNYTDLTFDQCISFFDVVSGDHIGTYKIGFNKFNPQLQVSYPDYFLRRSFLWSKNSSGVYVITHDKALFLAYDSNFVIIEVDSVPERPINTNSGNISNNGKLLQVAIDGNRTSLNIVQLDDWIPFDSLELIPKETNTYSLY